MDNSNYSPSELIDLALDCELNNSQATSLFELLAQDSALQEEFRQAVAIRRALTNDILAGIPSLEFTQSLFQRAGVEMTGDVTPKVLAKSSLNWSTLATTAFIFLGIGIAAAFGINKFALDESEEGLKPLALPQLYSMNILSNSRAIVYSSSQLNDDANNNLSPFHTPIHHHNQKQSKGTTDSVTIMPENNGAELSVGLSSEMITITEPANSLKIAASETSNKSQVINGNLSVDYSAIDEEKHSMIDYTDRGLSLQVRGILGIRLFNNQSSAVPISPFMNNLGITLKYELSDKHAVGFEVGQEAFPSIVETEGGRLQPTSSIAWTGLTYQYTMPPIKSLGSLRPFIQTVGGATGFGPIAKGIVGLKMPVKNRISIFAAAEGTFMGYRYHSNWYSSQKISFCSGLVMNF